MRLLESYVEENLEPREFKLMKAAAEKHTLAPLNAKGEHRIIPNNSISFSMNKDLYTSDEEDGRPRKKVSESDRL